MKTYRRKGNFLSLLVKNYVVFTISLLVVMITLYMLFTVKIDGILAGPDIEGLLRSKDEITCDRYEEIDVNGFLGDDGYITVIDSNNRVIYQSSSQGEAASYTHGELECIPDYEKHTYVTTQDYQNHDNHRFVAVSINATGLKSNTPSDIMLVLKGKKSNDKDFIFDENTLNNELYILDENLNIIYSTKPTDHTAFTESEFKYLTGSFSPDYDIQKYNFANQGREARTMLIYTKKPGEGLIIHKISKEFFSFIVILIISYLIIIALFIAWMNRRIKNPLVLLNDAIVNFSVESCEKPLKYTGSKEFVEICDSFNSMSHQLFESEAKRRQSEESKQKMLADISHDLKTPITVIKGYSKALCDGLVSEEEKDQYLLAVYQKSDGLAGLIDTFCEYSILEHPHYKLLLEPHDICEFSREYLAEKYNEIYLAEFSLELNIPEEPIYCSIDGMQLRRVFENIIGNALKHNKKGTLLGFTLWDDSKDVKIFMGDSGIGIPEESFESVFEPFSVGDKSRNQKYGSGLGLAICRKIIRLHDGEIGLSPNPPAPFNTMFEITLHKQFTL